MSESVCVRMNIQIYLYQILATNEYPNIFLSKKLTRTNIWIYSYPKMIRMNIRRNILIKNIQIFENIRHTLVWRSLNNIGILAYPRKASEATMQCEDLFMADDDLFLDAHCRNHHLPYICPNCLNWDSRNSLIRMEFFSSHCTMG